MKPKLRKSLSECTKCGGEIEEDLLAKRSNLCRFCLTRHFYQNGGNLANMIASLPPEKKSKRGIAKELRRIRT